MPAEVLSLPYSYAFQPVLDLRFGTLHHYEALFRSSDQNLSTGDLIQAFETNGVIGSLDRRGVKHLARIADSMSLPIAVNISASSIEDRSFHAYVHRALNLMKKPHHLHFELTETQPLSDFACAADFVRMVQSFGCKVALDDYGSGYMNPRHVIELGADSVKIDGQIVRDLGEDDRRRVATAFILDTVALADSVGASVVAECLENQDLVEEVRFLGVQLGQGYHLGRPAPLATLMHARQARKQPMARAIELQEMRL